VGTSEVPHFGLYKGIEYVKRFFSIISDINQIETFEVLSYTETENGAYVECRERGHFKDRPQAFELRSCQILEIENGKIIRFRIYQDTSQMVDAWRS
jgi:ketosteroid isomerase-like protein